MTDAKITAKQLMERLANNEQLPSNGDIDDDFPCSSPEVYSVVADYWCAVDQMKETINWIKRLAENEEA